MSTAAFPLNFNCKFIFIKKEICNNKGHKAGNLHSSLLSFQSIYNHCETYINILYIYKQVEDKKHTWSPTQRILLFTSQCLSSSSHFGFLIIHTKTHTTQKEQTFLLLQAEEGNNFRFCCFLMSGIHFCLEFFIYSWKLLDSGSCHSGTLKNIRGYFLSNYLGTPCHKACYTLRTSMKLLGTLFLEKIALDTITPWASPRKQDVHSFCA